MENTGPQAFDSFAQLLNSHTDIGVLSEFRCAVAAQMMLEMTSIRMANSGDMVEALVAMLAAGRAVHHTVPQNVMVDAL